MFAFSAKSRLNQYPWHSDVSGKCIDYPRVVGYSNQPQYYLSDFLHLSNCLSLLLVILTCWTGSDSRFLELFFDVELFRGIVAQEQVEWRTVDQAYIYALHRMTAGCIYVQSSVGERRPL